MKNEKLGIIICNFNKKDYLKNCLISIFESSLDKKTYEVIVIDNASTDGATQMVKDEFKQVILLENKINIGGSGGFAKGMKFAIKQKYEYVALLDNDIRLDKNTLHTMLKYIKTHNEVGVVGAKICQMDCPDILQDYGIFIDKKNYELVLNCRDQKDTPNLPNALKCDYVPACCLMTKKDVLTKVGVFDDKHFIYWDDVDWCTRVRKNGYEVHVIKNARVLHKRGAQENDTTFQQYYFEKNQILYFLKYLNNEELTVYVDKLCEKLINITFFSNKKGSYNSAISALLAIDDLERGMFGRQDKRALPKENINMLEKLNIDKKHNIFISLEGVKLIASRKIYRHLKEHFENEIKFIQNKKCDFDIRKEFENVQVVCFDAVKPNDIVFYECEHILKFDTKNIIFSNGYIIDYYLNVSKIDEIENFIDSYNTYKEIFHSIYKPVLKEKLLYIKKRYLNE